MPDMTRTIRLFLFLEGASFAVASLVHTGALVGGYEDPGAMIAEAVIATVLLAGCALSLLWRAATRAIGLGAQGFALLGTCIGTYLSFAGVGASTVPDRIYHVGILSALIYGLYVTARAGSERQLPRLGD
jgi:hypothetical protein